MSDWVIEILTHIKDWGKYCRKMKQLAPKEREKIEREESLELRKQIIKTKQAKILCIDASFE